MLALTVDRYGYLSVDAETWLDSFSEVSETWTEAFNAYCLMRASSSYNDRYVTSDMVSDWAYSLGQAFGIYGEGNPVTVATCNVDSFLENDVTYTFLHLEAWRRDGEGIEYPNTHTLIVVHGHGYMAETAGYAEVREFNGDDDGDAFSYASGFAAHSDNENCAEWIIESACILWPNGGGTSYRISDCITTVSAKDGEEVEAFLSCPLCGDRLEPYVH